MSTRKEPTEAQEWRVIFFTVVGGLLLLFGIILEGTVK